MTKIYLYLKKEIELNEEKDLEKLNNILKKLYESKVFDEIFILKDKEIEELEKFRDIYLYSAIKDLKYLKEENKILKELFRKLLKLIHELKDSVVIKR